MKIKEFKIKHKKEWATLNYIEFNSLEELASAVPKDEALKIYHYGAKELAKWMYKNPGKQPFESRRKTIKINLQGLSPQQLEVLGNLGLIPDQAKPIPQSDPDHDIA